MKLFNWFNILNLTFRTFFSSPWSHVVVDWVGIRLSVDIIIISNYCQIFLSYLGYCHRFLQNDLIVSCPLVWCGWDFKDFVSGSQVVESLQLSSIEIRMFLYRNNLADHFRNICIFFSKDFLMKPDGFPKILKIKYLIKLLV